MYQIRCVKTQEVNEALTLLFCPGGSSGSDSREVEAKVKAFRAIALKEKYDISRHIVVLRGDKMVFSCLSVPNEGRTAFIYSSVPNPADPQLDKYAVEAVQQLCRWTISSNNNLLEVLLDTEDTVRKEIFLRCDFRKLTDLIYLSRASTLPVQQPNINKNVSWLNYNQKNHNLFKNVIRQTYHDSLDCPELENMRDVEDVVQSHKAAGAFDPRWWKLLSYNDEPCGVLLLSLLPDSNSMELVYMGLTPSVRGRGWGQLLLQEAVECSRQSGVSYLMLAVDCRNYVARKLYKQFDFTEFLRRTVLLYTSPTK
ncbi:MAG: GNAT family N-acetyltransferase [Sedimentisphaerales bacterium]|nr:GNAT family N-acetyltransferase [Sedimentisphaerales bacterium]